MDPWVTTREFIRAVLYEGVRVAHSSLSHSSDTPSVVCPEGRCICEPSAPVLSGPERPADYVAATCQLLYEAGLASAKDIGAVAVVVVGLVCLLVGLGVGYGVGRCSAPRGTASPPSRPECHGEVVDATSAVAGTHRDRPAARRGVPDGDPRL